MRVAVACVAVLFGAGLLALSVAAAPPPRTEPVPIGGVPLDGKTNLQLLVASAPPFVLDVDSGHTAAIHSIPDMRRGVVSVQDLGGRAALIVTGGFNSKVYVLRRRRARPLLLGTARSVVPAADGRSLWIKSATSNSQCILRQVGLNGHQLGEPRPITCSRTISPGGSLGLVESRTTVTEPQSGRTVVTTRYGILAAAGNRLVLAGPEKNFTLLDTGSGDERVLPWPSSLYGLDAPRADKQGRYVALSFADPAWKGGQAMDVWTIDTHTGQLAQLPGMPALVDLKFTSMEWTRDGRLVFLVERDGTNLVALWRPGETHLQLKPVVRLPKRSGGSDAFAILP